GRRPGASRARDRVAVLGRGQGDRGRAARVAALAGPGPRAAGELLRDRGDAGAAPGCAAPQLAVALLRPGEHARVAARRGRRPRGAAGAADAVGRARAAGGPGPGGDTASAAALRLAGPLSGVARRSSPRTVRLLR